MNEIFGNSKFFHFLSPLKAILTFKLFFMVINYYPNSLKTYNRSNNYQKYSHTPAERA